MADVGVGQKQTAFLRYRMKKVADAISDNHFIMAAAKKEDGIKRINGGRSILLPALSGANSTVEWGGEKKVVSLADDKVLDSPEFDWSYLYGSVSLTLAEQYQNEGEGREQNILVQKSKSLELTTTNIFHAALNSNGTGSGGLQLDGLPAHISTTPTTGTRGTIDLTSANATWYANQKFDADNDWSDGAVDSSNVLSFLDKGIDATTREGMSMLSCFILGQGTGGHWEAATKALRSYQQIVNVNDTGKLGFQKMVYRGIPLYQGGGINFSGESTISAKSTYGVCFKEEGFNIVFHKKAEFDILSPINAQDQTAFSRLMFTMCATTTGGLSKFNWVGFNA